jgi:hypothetical protein
MLSDVDVRFDFMPATRAEAGGGGYAADGLSGCTQVRLKLNLQGNDRRQPGVGDAAVAIMSSVAFSAGSDEPTNHRPGCGMIFPLAVARPADFAMGLMAEVDLVYNEASGGRGVALVHAATIGQGVDGDRTSLAERVEVGLHETGCTYQSFRRSRAHASARQRSRIGLQAPRRSLRQRQLLHRLRGHLVPVLKALQREKQAAMRPCS